MGESLHLPRVGERPGADGQRCGGRAASPLARVAHQEDAQAVGKREVAVELRVLVGLGRADIGHSNFAAFTRDLRAQCALAPQYTRDLPENNAFTPRPPDCAPNFRPILFSLNAF